VDPQKWTHILTLFSVVILADRRVYKEEVDTFVEQTLALKDEISPKMIFSKKMAMDWFFQHRDEISNWAQGIDPHEHTKKHIMALGDSAHCQKILSALYAVAVVDGEYHKAESRLINLACEHWNLPHPSEA